MPVEPLRILRVDSLHFYVHDLPRTRRFFVDQLDFAEIGGSDENLDRDGRQHSSVFRAGDVTMVVAEARGSGGRAWRFLQKHPEGVGTIVFEVEDIDHTFKLLESRGGTPIEDVQRFEDDGGTLSTFSITTPFGDATFRFVQRDGYRGLFPRYRAHEAPLGGSNKFGFTHIDHITSNFQTMAPTLLWLEHVMGFERYWGVEFHTRDVAGDIGTGSGLRSAVMWDPFSGTKFANNEPLRPHFKNSQINLFGADHRGDGIQHAALHLPDIVSSVAEMRQRGCDFMPTPGTYYDMLPARLERLGIGTIDEDIQTLRDLEILVDGKGEKSYLLQIFLRDAAARTGDNEAGPFFIEVIQRKGDKGFGAGNFRALFESIERAQLGRIGIS